MFNKYFVLLLLGVALVTGCIDPRWEGDEHVISIQPLYPQAGEKVVIRYNQRHQDARYKSDTLLYATLRTTSNTEGWRDFRMAMKRSPHDSAQWETTFVVPSDLTGFGVSIAPISTMMSNETYATPVYVDEEPVQGALPIQISTAKTLDEALVLFRKDAELYPHAYDRWCQLWIGKIKSGFNKDSVLCEVDSVEHELHKTTLSNNDRVVGLSACACAYSLLGKWDKARAAILQIKPLCRAPLPFSAVTAFELTVGAVHSSSVPMSSGKRALLQDIADIVIRTQNLFLSGKLLARTDSSTIAIDTLYRPLLSMAVQRISREQSSAIRYATQFSAILDGLIWQNRYVEAVDAGTQFLGFLNDVKDWPALGMQQAVDVFPYEGVKASTRHRIARAYLAQGETASAERELKMLVLDPPKGMMVEGTIYRASIDLAVHYLSLNSIDSAEKYCAYAGRFEQMEHRFRAGQKILDSINKSRKYMSTRNVVFPELFVKYQISSQQAVRYTGVRISTAKGEVAIDSTDRTLYLFFVDEQCSICKEIVPHLLSALVSKGVRLQDILLLSENNADHVQTVYGKKYTIAPLTAQTRKTFSIAAFPTLIVVKKGYSFFRRDGLSDKTLRELIADL